MRKVNIIWWAILILVVPALGCSGGGGNPLTPSNDNLRYGSTTPNQQMLLGHYDISIDTNTFEIEVLPIRGPQFQANVIMYLQPPAGNPANIGLALNPGGTDISQGIIDIDISITHPFPGTNMRGFDVRAIVMGKKATQLSWYDYDIQYPKPDEFRLLNADGYTRWWNAVEFLTPGLFGYTPGVMGNTSPKGTTNAYKYFCDGLGASDPLEIPVDTRGTFSTEDAQGDPNTLTRQYIMKFPMVGGAPQVQFQYAICASFMPPPPDTTPPGPVEVYPIEANCPEVYRIGITVDPSSTAYFVSTQSGGDLVLNIELFDWQVLEYEGGVPAQIDHFILESPSLWDGFVDPLSSGILIPSMSETSSVWQVEIPDVTPTSVSQDIFVTVQSKDPISYSPPNPGSAIYPGGTLAAYFLYTYELPGNSAPIIGVISGPSKYSPGALLEYSLSSMTDLQDGNNLTVHWDFDGDGVFEDDEDGNETNKKSTYTFPGPGVYNVQCRVTDTQDAYTDSNVLEVEPMSLPYDDPMDASTQTLWHVENGITDLHDPPSGLEWNVQGDHWSTSSAFTGQYDDYMNTMLVSPQIPAGVNDEASVTISHRYETEIGYDDCQVYTRINSGGWLPFSPLYDGASPGYPNYQDIQFQLTSLNPGDLIEIGFLFDSDSSFYDYAGWDATHLTIIDNKPPVIEGIWGPQSIDTFGPVSYSTVATDLDGIASYMWSLEADGILPVYDDPGDGMGNLEAYFPADGLWDLYVEATDAGDPPLSSTFGPYGVIVFSINPDAFFADHFETDTGTWTYTGGIGDGSYQDFWHIDIPNSMLDNVGPDGCYAEEEQPIFGKTASADITFPDTTNNCWLKLLHQLDTESGGFTVPYDGQWVEIDGTLVKPTYGFLYDDNFGNWSHGYFVGDTSGYVVSSFDLGTEFNDGLSHTIVLHQLCTDVATNCMGGWQIDYIEFWEAD